MEENLQGSIYFVCDNSIDYFYTLYIYIFIIILLLYEPKSVCSSSTKKSTFCEEVHKPILALLNNYVTS